MLTGSGLCGCEDAAQCSLALASCASITFLPFFPTVALHFSLKRSKVLDVDVKLNFLRVLRTQLLTSKPLISLQEFLRSLESEKRPEIFFQLGNRGTILCSSSLIVTLLLSSVWKYERDWLSSISRTDWHSLSLLLRPSSLGQKEALDSLGWQNTSLLAWIAVVLFLLILLRQSSILVASSIEQMFCTRSHSGMCDSTIARNASTNYFSPSRPVLRGIMQAPEKISQLIHTRIVLLSMKIIPTVGRKNPQMEVSATKLLKILRSCSQGLPSWPELSFRKKLRLNLGACSRSHLLLQCITSMLGTSAAAICLLAAQDQARPSGGLKRDFLRKNSLKSIERRGVLCKLGKLCEQLLKQSL